MSGREDGADGDGGDDERRPPDGERDGGRERLAAAERERRRESRRPPRALRLAAAVGLGVAFLFVVALGVAVLFGGLAPGGLDVPQATLDFRYDADARTVTVEHAGGAAFTTENSGRLYVAVNDTSRRVVGLPFEEGDTVTVENVSAGTEVAVVWVASNGDERAVGSAVAGPASVADPSRVVSAGPTPADCRPAACGGRREWTVPP